MFFLLTACGNVAGEGELSAHSLQPRSPRGNLILDYHEDGPAAVLAGRAEKIHHFWYLY